MHTRVSWAPGGREWWAGGLSPGDAWVSAPVAPRLGDSHLQRARAQLTVVQEDVGPVGAAGQAGEPRVGPERGGSQRDALLPTECSVGGGQVRAVGTLAQQGGPEAAVLGSRPSAGGRGVPL